jgi:hypothetical protein
MVSVRPANVTSVNQDFAVEKQIVTVAVANFFTYPNIGGNTGALADVGPDGASGSWVLRPRQTTGPSPAAAEEWIMYRKADIETPDPSGSGRFVSIEITNGLATDDLIVDHCSLYVGARETKLTNRSVSAAVTTGSWQIVDARGDDSSFSGAFDHGRNWYTEPDSGSPNPMGRIFFRARENMRVRVSARFRFNNTSGGGGAIVDGRLRVMKNETYSGTTPAGGGTEVLRGQVFTPGGADLGVTDDELELDVGGLIEVVEGDVLTVEQFINTSGFTALIPSVNLADNFAIYKQESVD